MPDTCSCCSLSRRCFLGVAGMVSVGALTGSAQSDDSKRFAEPIDVASFRPKPKVRILNLSLRQKTPYWLGWPGASYDLEGKRKEFTQAFDQAATRTGVTLEHRSQPVDPSTSLEELIRTIQAQPPDALLLHLEHLNCWKMAEQIITGAGVPAIVFAPIGMAFTGHVLNISRRKGICVISSMETSAVEQAMRMVRAKKQFAETRLLVVAGKERSETTLDILGTKIRRVPRPSLQEIFEGVPATEEAHAVSKRMRRGARKTIEPSEQDTLNAARSYVAAKHLLRKEEANAITSDCLGMVQTKIMPTPPCMAATLFQDAGVTYGCEADVFGAMSLMLSSYLCDTPGFMNDPVPETVKNVLIAAHCVSPTLLNGFGKSPEPYLLRSHSESAIGVSLQVLWRESQPVTLARFKTAGELIIDTGKVITNVNTPPAGGCRTSFEIAMDNIEDVRDVQGFHQVVFYGNHRRALRDFCQMYGIKAVHSPEHPPEVA